jgi:hypothetical protein
MESGNFKILIKVLSNKWILVTPKASLGIIKRVSKMRECANKSESHRPTLKLGVLFF